jgi:CRP-like cAMP-binding protein
MQTQIFSRTTRRSAKLSVDDATTLAIYGARTTWPANFQIYQRGTPADGISLVLRGHVVLKNRARSGRSFVPAIVIPGETFGIEGLSPEASYVTDAYASEECETLFVSGAQFRAFVRENPTKALHVVGQLMSERSALLEKLHAMASQNVEQRLICALRRIAADKTFLARDGRIRLELKHHRLLCEMVGATRESIALALGRLVGSGVADKKGMVFFVAPSRLADHINGDGMDSDVAISSSAEAMPPHTMG